MLRHITILKSYGFGSRNVVSGLHIPKASDENACGLVIAPTHTKAKRAPLAAAS